MRPSVGSFPKISHCVCVVCFTIFTIFMAPRTDPTVSQPSVKIQTLNNARAPFRGVCECALYSLLFTLYFPGPVRTPSGTTLPLRPHNW